MLINGWPQEVPDFFIKSNVDPRELIILFDELQKDLRPSFNEHIHNQRNMNTTLRRQYNTLQMSQGTNMDAELKVEEAKRAIKIFFRDLNKKYLIELGKDENKLAEFARSDYNMNPDVIKED